MSRFAEEAPGLKETLQLLNGQFTDEKMSELTYRVDVEGEAVDDVARDFLISAGCSRPEPLRFKTAPGPDCVRSGGCLFLKNIYQGGLLHLRQQLQLTDQLRVGGGVLVGLLQGQVLIQGPEAPEDLVGVRVAHHHMKIGVMGLPEVKALPAEPDRPLPVSPVGQLLGLFQLPGPSAR